MIPLNQEEQHPSEPLTVYTIGHSNVPASKLVELLRRYEVQVVVDVRSSPYSQYAPQYNRELLERTLKEAGIEYKYAGDHLGGRPKDPTCYKDKQLPDGKADYLHEVDYQTVMTKDWYQKGIKRLIEIARDQRAAVLCSEEDPARCHRHHLIGKTLVQKNIQVLHIRGDGNLVKDQMLPDLPEEPPATQLSFF